jgi:hypothetical protein
MVTVVSGQREWSGVKGEHVETGTVVYQLDAGFVADAIAVKIEHS